VRRLLPLPLIAVAGCGSGVASAGYDRPFGTIRGTARHASRAFPPASAQRAQLRHLRRVGLPVYCAGGRRRTVALTFDDGPGPYTRLALKELHAAGAHATFFLVAKSIRSYPVWPRREANGASLGDHTATHVLLPVLARDAMRHQIAVGQGVASRSAHVPIRLFRPPYGAFDRDVTRTARRLGMVEIIWSVDSGDSIGGNFHAISARVRRAVRPGAIVLFHENRGQTIRALRSILPLLHRRGLRSVTVPELLAADPPTPAQLAAGRRGCGPERGP